ncbi:uncharacterized protein [Rutidosis leptorrhynchoides]|uniref:uncharacterized protein n=1 Tax=Rutidosis leptorrhynchoides TaxID=125765 RepID=UPI003A995776
MEQNQPILAKKVWNLVRVAYFMLRKNISKRKLLLDLNMMVKRGKIASKALQNLMFHHHHHNNGSQESFMIPPPGEYEFSCTNTPSTNNRHHTFSLFPFHKKQHYSNNQSKEDADMIAINAAVWKAMEMIHSETTSPVLPGFGMSPMVRQLRVTDSPFPLTNGDEDSHVVDEAAERFINRFYNDLRKQNTNAIRE